MKLFVGVGKYRLDMSESRSLKDKRRLVKSVLGRLNNNKITAACEVESNDSWKTGTVAVVCPSSSLAVIKKCLENSRKLIETSGIEVVEEERWMFNPGEEEGQRECLEE